jgi:hypothetical protein
MTFKKADVLAEDSADSFKSLMCKAHGCPNRWSVDLGGGGLCSRHAWVDPSKWGEVTREMAVASSYGTPAALVKAVSEAEKEQILRRLSEIGSPSDPKLWAKALQEREKRGDRLTPFQKSAWREALRVRDE